MKNSSTHSRIYPSTFIIAEAGVNHNGNIELAKKLIDAAVSAKADAVKFQSFITDNIVTAQAAKANYQTKNTDSAETQLEMLRRLELSPSAYKELFKYCERKGIICMSTPFDEESADVLDKIGMKIFKIASGEITNKLLIRHIAKKGKPIILSTGMSYLSEVEKAVNWIMELNEWNGRLVDEKNSICPLTLLHCVSNYPALPEDSNLLAMKTLAKAFGFPVGYSDHTLGIEVSIAAVSLGAKVIEKHLTLDKNMKGPDHKASLEPQEFADMVDAIRNIDKALGDGIKRPMQNENGVKMAARKSLVAARDIKAGDILSSANIAIKRPGSGIPPEFKDIVVGMKASCDIKADSIITWEHVKGA